MHTSASQYHTIFSSEVIPLPHRPLHTKDHMLPSFEILLKLKFIVAFEPLTHLITSPCSVHIIIILF